MRAGALYPHAAAVQLASVHHKQGQWMCRCHWCQRLEPTWEKVVQEVHRKYPESDGRLRFAKARPQDTCFNEELVHMADVPFHETAAQHRRDERP